MSSSQKGPGGATACGMSLLNLEQSQVRLRALHSLFSVACNPNRQLSPGGRWLTSRRKQEEEAGVLCDE